MRLPRRVALAVTACLAVTSGFTSRAAGAHYPDGPVRIVYPGSVASTGDQQIRRLAEHLSAVFGQRFFVENKVGALTAIASDEVAAAAPDGRTLLAVFNTFVTAPALLKRPGYDPVRDFAPVARLSISSPILVVQGTSALRSVQDLLALARAKPGEVSFAHSGAGGGHHIPAVLLARAARVAPLFIPYRGEAPALSDLLGGQVTAMFVYPAAALSPIQAGRLRPLAVAARQRHPALPQVPTLAEAGWPGCEYAAWLGVVAPARTPPEVIDALARAIAAFMSTTAVRASAQALGVQIAVLGPVDFGALIRREVAHHGALIKALGLTPE